MNKQNVTALSIVNPFLRGVGQVMLQRNALTGLLFLASLCYGSLIVAMGAIFAVTVATCTAKLFRYDQEEISSGIYGFSATLVGVALATFYQPTAIVWIAILLGAVMVTLIQHFFIARKLPAFTFPFIVVTWLFQFIFHQFPLLVHASVAIDETSLTYPMFTLIALGFGQVIFQGTIGAGILFLVGVGIAKPIAAIYGAVGAITSGMIAYLLGIPLGTIYMGLYSYNAVLCAIAFAGNKRKDMVLAGIAVTFSVAIMVLMRNMGIPALTFPFVLACWLTLVVKAVWLKLKA